MSAAGERHAEEISKILAETDVYVKYGLHQKAVDHLRRVFTLDAENVEAHERLKDIFVSQGREQEAEVELLKLAELVAPSDPDRAEAYLQELLAMNGTHTGAFELARRFRLRVARMSSVSAEVEYGGGGVVPIGRRRARRARARVGAADASPAGRWRVARARCARLGRRLRSRRADRHGNGRCAHGSPAPGRPPRAPDGAHRDDDDFELDFEPSPSQATRQMSPEQVEALASLPGDEAEDDEPVFVEPPGNSGQWSQPFDDYGASSSTTAVDAQLDDAALGDDIDHEVAARARTRRATTICRSIPTRRARSTPPSSEDRAIRTSAASRRPSCRASTRRGVAASDTASFEDARSSTVRAATIRTAPRPCRRRRTIRPRRTHVDRAAATSTRRSAVDDSAASARRATSRTISTRPTSTPARACTPRRCDVLDTLLARYPNHRLIHAKLREVEALIARRRAADRAIAVDGRSTAEAAPSGTDAIDLDEIEEVGDDEIDESTSSPQPRRSPASASRP